MKQTQYLAGFLLAGISACSPTPPPAAPPPPAPPAVAAPFALTAGITDIMKYLVDPSADALWESVGTYVDKRGTVNRQPHTDEEWAATRGRAITLAEAANLLMMDGRRVALPGHEVEDSGTAGNLTAAQAQEEIDRNREAFLGFARALNQVGTHMVDAADKKDAPALLNAGAALDEVCEGCHLKFWYPGQKIPRFPDEARETTH
jgi:hypothetical protein